MANNESFADSTNITNTELNSLSQEYSLVPDDPRLRLPWDFSNFTRNRSRRQIASAVVQLRASTDSFRRHGGQIRVLDGDFGEKGSSYWPGAPSSEDPSLVTCLKYELDQYGQPMWNRLCILTGLKPLNPDKESLNDFIRPSATVVTDFSKETLFGLLPLKRETRMLRWLFKSEQAYFTTQHFILHLTVDHLEINVQFAWYQRGNDTAYDGLLRGHLYGSDTEENLVQQTWQIRATVHTPASEMSTPTPNTYQSWAAKHSRWAILIAEPPRLRSPEKFYTMQITLLREIHRALHSILIEWDYIISHIQSLLSIEQAILHPELHDRLLFDEQDFSTSRKYFWIINSTEEFHRQIEETEKTYISFFKEHIEGPYALFVELGEIEKIELRELGMWETLAVDHKRILSTLGALLVQLRTQRDRAIRFRDGLFSASSVVESRASTRLGQNVKLLTYVSIFYLPLGFITSLWSIPDATLTPTSLIPTIIIVGLITYFLVFNLHNISTTISNYYLSLKQSLLTSMQKHGDKDPFSNHSNTINITPKPTPSSIINTSITTNPNLKPTASGFWPKIAARYNHFSPPRWDPHPSEWLIFTYLIMQVFVYWPAEKVVRGFRWLKWPWGEKDDLEREDREDVESGSRSTLSVVMTEEMVLDVLFSCNGSIEKSGEEDKSEERDEEGECKG